jgi:diaminohydroxyphosphoribosylaminopyrimidine deaminase/5-amino-6-(5-phosphoribosylamino)uracil reductase
MPPAPSDESFMRRALALARQGEGYVSPNPMVGCVIVRGDRVVGEGFHQRFGGPHAEIHALRQAGEQARGAVLYVTLEPCCHTGKTPPCVDAILRAGPARVVVALRDPNPLVAGGGLARLRQAGIEVTSGVCEDEARRLNEAFLTYVSTQCPFVTLKCAVTLDGKIATRTGHARWITGERARAKVHELRHASDAIVVGIGTVVHDDPLLTTRLPDRCGVNPLRVIVDSSLRLPVRARVTEVTADCRTLVAATAQAAPERQSRLEGRGVEIVRLPADAESRRVDLEALLVHLGQRGIASVLVEGGATLGTAFLQRRLVDKILCFIAPKIIGGDGLSVVGPCGVQTMEQAIRFRDVTFQSYGDDVLLQGYRA